MTMFQRVRNVVTTLGRPQDLAGGGAKKLFFQMRYARGVRGYAPPRKFFKMVRFGVYFDQILSLKTFKNYYFLYKKFKNCNFLYKRIKILDTRNIILVKKNFEKFMIDAFWYLF